MYIFRSLIQDTISIVINNAFESFDCSGFMLNHSKISLFFSPVCDPRSDLMTRVHLCSVHLGYTLT